ncbi:PDC sensor domain-containing protein [Solidesulfovibrio sp.]
MRAVTVFLLALVAISLVRPAPLPAEPAPSPLAAALIATAAGRLDDALADLEHSAKGLGTAYRDLLRARTPFSPEERSRMLQSYAAKDGTVAFRDLQGPCGPEPAAKAPCQSLFFYDGENFTDAVFSELAALSRLAPAMTAAAEALPASSWVYLTTPGQSFAIYPHLPLAEAVNNYKPTEKGYYTVADFAAKACGWESPYLDLVGDGMMVTVSCPVYDGETLLAVASRDVTLGQLSRQVLTDLAAIPGARAFLINRRGKAIAASDPELAAFLDAENARAGDAVVYFRADRGLAAMGLEKGQDSPDEAVNAAGEAVIERAGTATRWPMAFAQGKDLVLAARLRTTGWYLVLLLPQKAAR